MRKENSDFKTEFLSEAGTFMENRDYFAFVELDDMACWVAADGLDSDQEAHSAEMVVQLLLENFTDKPTMSRRKLDEYLQEANDWLRYESRRVRLKASLIMVVTDYTRMVWAVAGNARLYHFRGGRLLGVSRDLSLAQSMADELRISQAAVDRHEERHNLLEYVGKPEQFQPFVSKKTLLAEGDVLLLVTSGLWEGVDIPEMLDVLEEAKEPTAMVDMLEEVLLSKQRPTIANYTAAAVYADKVFKEERKSKKKMIKWIIITLIPLLIMLGFLIYYKSQEAKRLAETVASMLEHAENGDEFAAEENYAEAMKEFSEARNASIKIKDKVHTLLYTKKYKIAQSIVTGDSLLKDGSYEKAEEQFAKAKKSAEKDEHFDPLELDKRIQQAAAFKGVQEKVKEADLLMESQDYAGAIEIYKKARNAAIHAGFASGEKDIKSKLEEAESKLKALEKEQKKLLAEKQEQRGDRSNAMEDYAGAIDAYAKAQQTYQEIGLLENVLAMERKIAKADEMLNPIPLPSTGNGGSNGEPGGASAAGTDSDTSAGGSSAGSSGGGSASGTSGNSASGTSSNTASGASGNSASGTNSNTASGTSGNSASGTSGNTASGASGNSASGTSGNSASGTSSNTASGTSGNTASGVDSNMSES
ncbi:serine/threonine protein phosphatase [Paenibacillus plantiphilus]|nr:serine/threonine protein phosphatase [Paenibacillus plantiphilus]